ncbi:MAG: hypothetical protein L6R40_004565 [Gallowayella cf. fulva]|nr:MAG: hypothetical protein L6R40_004565 [Xanthomendoza cf. fulva]
MGSCPAVEVPDKDKLWSFCPNIAAAYLLTILFAFTTCAHFAQAILYRKGYCWVIVMSALWQTVCYLLRVLSIKQPSSMGYYSGWFILILVSPLWTNAFVYMVMGRMVYNFTSRARLFGIKAWRYTLYFVLLDILAFIIQAGGATYASGKDKPTHTVLLGLHIYMGGVGFQQFFVLVFFYITFRFQQQIKREEPHRLPQALTLLYAEFAALALITVRIIFRLVEYSKGLDSTIPNHEAYQYIFDTLPMLVALAIYNVFHPGRIMPGKESDFPSRKERKNYSKANNSPNSSQLLPTQEASGNLASMPEETAFQPKPQSVPGYGHIQ